MVIMLNFYNFFYTELDLKKNPFDFNFCILSETSTRRFVMWSNFFSRRAINVWTMFVKKENKGRPCASLYYKLNFIADTSAYDFNLPY